MEMRSSRVIVALLCALSGVQALAVRCEACPKLPCCDQEPSSQPSIAELPPCCRLKQATPPANRTITNVEHQSQLGPLLAAAWPPAPITPPYTTVAPTEHPVSRGPPLYHQHCALLL
jgi:hypothetical protein